MQTEVMAGMSQLCESEWIISRSEHCQQKEHINVLTTFSKRKILGALVQILNFTFCLDCINLL